jgi:hypothetical protein
MGMWILRGWRLEVEMARWDLRRCTRRRGMSRTSRSCRCIQDLDSSVSQS